MRHDTPVYSRIFAKRAAIAGVSLALGLSLTGCPRPPARSAASLAKITSVFTIGTIAIQTADDEHSLPMMSAAAKLAPEEPAVWANLGLLDLRKNDLDAATEHLNKAVSLLPSDASPQSRAALESLQALAADLKGDRTQAVAHLRQAVTLEPDNLINRYSLYQMLENVPDLPGALSTLQAIVERNPDNIVAWLQIARLSTALKNMAAYSHAVSALTRLSKGWPPSALVFLKALQEGEAHPASVENSAFIHLQNVLKPEAQWHLALVVLSPPLDQNDHPTLGVPMERFVKLPNAPDTPAPSDMSVTFTSAPAGASSSIGSSSTGPATWIGPLWLSNSSAKTDLVAPCPMYVAANTLHLSGPADQNDQRPAALLTLPGVSRPASSPLNTHSILSLDFNYDLLSDIFIACEGGLKLYLQTSNHQFRDATAHMKLPADLLNGQYTGAWGLDYDIDGDLDILIAREKGSPLILRNNGDGSFKALPLFSEVSGLRQFVWADLDGDGTPDAALLDAQGKLSVYMNQRSGHFKLRALPADVGKIAAIAASDINHDGKLDLILLRVDGTLLRLSDKLNGTQWEMAPLAAWKNAPADLSPETARLFIADLDNNGAPDIVASSPAVAQVWMNDGIALAPLPSPIPTGVLAAADLGNTGRMDLLGIDGQGHPVVLKNKGTKNYFWQDIRPRASERGEITLTQHRAYAIASELSKRVNSFGIGGEMEIRAGLLYQKQVINGPSVHFGLGEYPTVDVLRILWPNGDVRGEFEIKGDAIFSAEHRQNVSCPFLFTWNGDKMEFVTDCIWRSPLGLKINAHETAGVQMTEDWVKIRGDQLVPRPLPQVSPKQPDPGETFVQEAFVQETTVQETTVQEIIVQEIIVQKGSIRNFKIDEAEDAAMVYDLRITAELWETHFFDHLSLMTVDHPDETAIFCDERFAVPPPPLRVYATTLPRPVSRAWDDVGCEVTDLVLCRDGRHVANFGKGAFPGVTRDHWLEMEFGDEVPAAGTGPLYLIAHGWIWPTNSNINVALAQGDNPVPTGLSIETPDAAGCWSTRKQDLGFPEGKVKTIVLRIDDVFQPNAPRRLRLRTNLEIYWETLEWAVGLEDDESFHHQTRLQTTRLAARSAELRYRGFSSIHAKDAASPELPDSYERIARRNQKWRDLTGFYTRYGDVRELLGAVDDRYVIMNAGDELCLTFAVPPPPPPGWTRDFVLIGDGWVKDGNYNTTFSRTVLPLPSHADCDYTAPPGALEDDPVYQQHPSDWQMYHTRYVTADGFRNSLLPLNKCHEHHGVTKF